MQEQGFYKLSLEYIKVIRKLGGKYSDEKARPIYCCIQDKYNSKIYWAIPTSSIDNREQKQLDRIKEYCSYDKRDIRSSYYHIGHTNKEAIYKISNALPIIDKYIDSKYMSNSVHLVLKDKKLVDEISRKLKMILLTESKNHNKFEQHITDIYNYIVQEIETEEKLKQAREKENEASEISTTSEFTKI